MNRKQTLLLLVALVLVGTAGWLTLKRDQASWRSGNVAAGSKVLGDFDLNTVAKVVITSGAETVHLARKGEAWTVQERSDHPASFAQVAELIRKLWELKVVEVVRVGPSQLGRLSLEEPAKDKKTAGTLLDLQDANGKRIAALLLGKPYVKKSPETPDEAGGMPVGRYVRALGSDGPAALVNEAFLDASSIASRWLDHAFYQATPASSLTSAGVDGWTISRAKDGDEWQLAGAKPDEKLDAAKASAAASALQSPMFNEVRPATDAKGFQTPTVLTLKTFDHFIYQLTVGAPEGDAVPMKVVISAEFPPTRTPGEKETPEDKTRLDGEFANQLKQSHEKLTAEKRFEKWVYLVPKSQLDAALISRANLLAPKSTPSPSPTAAAVPLPPTQP